MLIVKVGMCSLPVPPYELLRLAVATHSATAPGAKVLPVATCVLLLLQVLNSTGANVPPLLSQTMPRVVFAAAVEPVRSCGILPLKAKLTVPLLRIQKALVAFAPGAKLAT